MDSRTGLEPRGAGAAGATLAWLGHPATVLALVVLILNDHVLKSAFPGQVTGKLSDVAGLVLTPPLVAVVVSLLLPRVPPRAAVTVGLVGVGVGFTAVKLSEYGASVASTAWSAVSGPSVVRADPTDLIALPALALAWYVWSRARRHPVSGRCARLVRALVVLPCALLGVAATSAPQYPHTVAVGEWDGRVVLGQSDGYHDAGVITQWLTSEDEGLTWSWVAESGPAAPEQVALRQDDCVPGDARHCYRVVPGRLRVEETVDAGVSWRVSWAVSDAARARLAADSYPDVSDVSTWLSSRSLVVRSSVGGGHVVLVANGRDGVARRAPDGTWTRIVFQPYGAEPLVMPGTVSEEQSVASRFADLPAELALSVVVGCLAFVLCVEMASWRAGNRCLVAVLPGLLTVAIVLLLPAFDPTNDLGRLAVVPAVLLAGFVSLGALAAVLGDRLVTGGRVLAAVGLAALTVLATAGPFLAWGVRLLDAFGVAVALAVVGATAGLVLALLAGLRAPARGQPGHVRDEQR